jgi:hypothetical protein
LRESHEEETKESSTQAKKQGMRMRNREGATYSNDHPTLSKIVSLAMTRSVCVPAEVLIAME